MKKTILFFLLSLCCCMGKGYAQYHEPYYDSTDIRFDTTGYFQYLTDTNYSEPTDTPFNIMTYIGSTLQYLDMNRVPHGVLYDKVPAIAGLLDFVDGANQKPSGNLALFHQGYFEYYNSITGNTQELHPDAVIAMLDSTYGDTVHPLMIIKANVDIISPYALDSGWVTLDSAYMLHDGPLNYQPYESFAITIPALGGVAYTLAPGEHKIVLDPAFLLGNDTTSIDSLFLNFTNNNAPAVFELRGIPRAQYLGLQPASFNIYQTDENVNLKVRIRFIDGREVISNIGLTKGDKQKKKDEGTKLEGCNGGDYFDVIGPDFPAGMRSAYSAAGATGPINAGGAKARYHIFWSDRNCNPAQRQSMRPVIFLDGFDPQNTRSVSNIYDDYINKSINYPAGTPIKMAEKIRQDGYDLIIVDYIKEPSSEMGDKGGGGDYIERNGMLLSAVIQDIYGGTHSGVIPAMVEDNVIIGPSYGALVVQYGLAWMEANSIAHHTRTFISFDGPHQGANVALGVQKFHQYLKMGALSSSLIGSFDDVLGCAGARQIIAHNISSGSESAPNPHAFRGVFMSDLSAVGWWPHNCRRVAITNGSRKGTSNERISGGEKILWAKKFTAWSLGLYQSLAWNVYATNLVHDRVSHNWLASIGLSALMWGIPVGWVNAYHNPAPNTASLDNCPGSYFNGIGDVANTVTLLNIASFVFLGVVFDVAKVNDFTFIPAISSADNAPFVFNLYRNYTNHVISNSVSNTTFDWVYADKSSTNHVEVNDEIGSRFINEIEQIDQDLGTYENYLSGPSSLCVGGITTYSIATLPTSGYITWSVSPNMSILSGQGTASVSVKFNSAGSGWVSCTAHPVKGNTINSMVTLKKPTVATAPPAPPMYVNTHVKIWLGLFRLHLYMLLTPPIYGHSYAWTVNFVNPSSTIYNYTPFVFHAHIQTIFTPMHGSSGFTLTATGACGSTTVTGGAFKLTEGNEPCLDITLSQDTSGGIADSFTLAAIAEAIRNGMQYYEADSTTTQDSLCSFIQGILDTMTLPGGNKGISPGSNTRKVVPEYSMVYPNPTSTSSELNVVFSKDYRLTDPIEVKVLDVTGRVYSETAIKPNDNTYKVSLDNLPPANYMLEIKQGDKKERFKFTKGN